MPALAVPAPRFRESFLAAMQEFVDEGRVRDGSMIGNDLERFGPTWHEPAGFAAYVDDLNAKALPETPVPDGWVHSTTWWWAEGDEYLGRIAVRHELNAWLLDRGGHIGYDVRRSRRREGHATAMLRAVLPFAGELGIDPALVTCDDTNVGSRTVIERAGGVFEDQRAEKLRFWVPTTG